MVDNIFQLLAESMRNWKTALESNRDTLGKVSIQRRIFHRESLSPLLLIFFFFFFIPLSINLSSIKYGYLLPQEKKTCSIIAHGESNWESNPLGCKDQCHNKNKA